MHFLTHVTGVYYGSENLNTGFSIRMEDILLPDFTLRLHKSSVTYLLVVELPQNPAPVLLSGDVSGIIVLWDLITRRPTYTYRIENEPQIVAFQYIEKYLIAVLCKDHKLRILRIKDSSRWEQIYEIPINTLNFANFLIQNLEAHWYRLICCNTEDSESIDIYVFQLSDLHSLKRVHRKLNFYEKIKPLLANKLKLDKLGIVMKFIECHGVVYCGMESGFVIGFKLHEHKSKDTRSQESDMLTSAVEIVYISNANYPNPILDLRITRDYILSSSTDDKVGIHNFPELPECEYPNHDFIGVRNGLVLAQDNFKQATHAEISHLKQVDNCLLLASWSGETIVLDQHYKQMGKFVKSKSNVQVNENPQGNINGNSDFTKNESRNCKITALEGISGVEARKSVGYEATLHMNGGKRRRITKFLQSNWCIIGYDDGSIAFYRLKNLN